MINEELKNKAKYHLEIGNGMLKDSDVFAIRTIEHSIKCAEALGKTSKVEELRKELAIRKGRVKK